MLNYLLELKPNTVRMKLVDAPVVAGCTTSDTIWRDVGGDVPSARLNELYARAREFAQEQRVLHARLR